MIDPVPRPRPPYLNREVTRHGRVVWFVRVYPGPRIRIRGEYGTPEFKAAYEAAIAGKPAPDAGESFPAQTIGWLIEQYRGSSAWGQLRPATRRQRDCILRSVLDTAGQQRIGRIDKAAIERGLDRRPNQYAQRHFLQTMRGLFKWAAAAKHIVSDPTSSVKTIRPRTDGHATWPQEWCDRFEARWALGTRQRLAYDVFLYTGLRIGDAVRLGRPHIKNGIATIRTEKNGEIITIPILPPLQASIDAGPIGELTFIAGERGKPLTKEACANWFRHACRAAGVPGSPHGLRKTAATRAADNGATEAELEALFGWRGGDMASLYTRAANRARLAKRAANKLLVENIMRISIPAPSQKVRGAEEKKK
jgi:integrase